MELTSLIFDSHENNIYSVLCFFFHAHFIYYKYIILIFIFLSVSILKDAFENEGLFEIPMD